MTTDLALDPPGLHSPRHYLGNATHDGVWLQLTHRGTPVWGCQNGHCEKFTVADTEPATGFGCGEEGLLWPVFHNRSFEDDDAVDAEFSAEPDTDRVTDRSGRTWWRNANPEAPGWSDGDVITKWTNVATGWGPLSWDGAR